MAEQSNENTPRLQEEDFLEALGIAFQQYGYDPTLLESEEYPLTLNVALGDPSGDKVEATLLFVPMEFLEDSNIQYLQIYLHLYTFGPELPRERLLELEHAANFCSCNTPVGTFGVQPEPGILCCKQGLPLRGDYGEIYAMTIAMDTVLLMLRSINQFYGGLIAIAKGESTLEQAQADGLLPTP